MPVLEARPKMGHGVQGQWIVLTAWEQVNTTAWDLTTNATSAIEAGSVAQTESLGTVQRVPDSGNRRTITHLIVRILPANLTFDQPTIQRVSNGWLVFQL